VERGPGDGRQPLRLAELVRLAEGQRLVGLVEWTGQLSFITRTDDALFVVQLPQTGS